jgi:predicted regulator of amino acid metabolism with ACT domain
VVNTTGGPLGNAGAHETLSEMRAKFSGLIYDFSVLNLIEEHEANAKKPAIIAHATSLLAKRRIIIRQVYAKDPELFENPTLVIITERPIPGSLVSLFSKIPAVRKVSIL